jgi:hypothetical protein
MTKTFNIGEYAIGGRIKVTLSKSVLQIQALDWATRSVVRQQTFQVDRDQGMTDATWFLEDLSTSYYADQIINFVKSKMNS